MFIPTVMSQVDVLMHIFGDCCGSLICRGENMAYFSIEDGMSRKPSFKKGENLNGKYIVFAVLVR